MEKVNLTPYSWSPGKVKEALPDDASAITATVLHALCDQMWVSQRRYEIKSPATEVRVALGLDIEAYKEAVLTLLDAGLLLRRYDDDNALNWVSPMLEEQWKGIEESDRAAKRHADRLEHENRQTMSRTSVRRRVSGLSPCWEPTVKYLSVDDRNVMGYMGWLPTSKFESRGQVVLISDEEVNSLILKYPDKDVLGEVTEIFTELMNNPSRRPGAVRMMDIINVWLSGEARKSYQGVNVHQLEDHLEHLPEMESVG